MRKNELTLKIILLLTITDFAETFYEFCFKKGMLLIGEITLRDFGSLVSFLVSILSNSWIWFGLIILFSELFLWFFILSRIDLSLAVPISSGCYIYVLLISDFILKENVGLNRWLGTILIILGVILTAQSANNKEKQVTELKT